MIKLPSIQTLLAQIVSIIKRFPLVILSATLLTFSFIYITHQDWKFKDDFAFLWAKFSMCCGLGLVLFLATALFSESKGLSMKKKIMVQGSTLAIIIGYYFTIDKQEDFNLESFTQYTLYIVAAHLFVAFSAFTGPNRINGFWQFNKTLFLRFLLSALYTGVLYGGIALAFWLMDDLLHITIVYTKYLYAWYILSGIVNTFIFLAGVPKDLTPLEGETSYPKGLKAFTQFVFLPFITLYLLILYAYFAKIIIHCSLPKGYVSYLVISFSTMGILSLLLIYPLRDNEENKWIKIFSRWYYVALYPLIILLGVSIYNRISQYGITEHRYFILVLAAWLVFIASYFLLNKKENIKIIPITLFALAILTSAGPTGAFSVSRHSQKNRLEKLLTENGILINGKIVKHTKGVNDSDIVNISSILRYLEEANAFKMLQPWFNQNLDSIHAHGYIPDSICKIMGIPFEPYTYSSHENSRGVEFELADRYSKSSINVKGFDYYSDFSYDQYERDTDLLDTTKYHQYLMVGNDSVFFVPYRSPCKYALMKNKQCIAIIDLNNFIANLYSQLDSTGNNYYIAVPEDKFMFERTSLDSTVYRFIFSSIDVRKIRNQSVIESMKAAVLTKHDKPL
jgi:hypothetical protein